MKRTSTPIALALFAVLAVAACAPTAAPVTAPAAGSGATSMTASRVLTGTSWTATAIDGAALSPETQATLEFGKGGDEAGRAFGSSGCNRWMAGYTQDGSKLNFTQPAGTMMACMGPAMAQEGVFLKIIATVDRFTIDPSGKLQVATPSGQTMSFAPKP